MNLFTCAISSILSFDKSEQYQKRDDDQDGEKPKKEILTTETDGLENSV